MVSKTGLDLADAEAVRRAVLALGQRLDALSHAAPRDEPAVEARQLSLLGASLLRTLETARLGASRLEALPHEAGRALDDALDMHQRNLPPRTEEERRWWEKAAEAARARLLPAWLLAARRLDAIEASPVRGLLLRQPAAMGLLCALPALLTIPLPVSTPLALVGLGLIGAFVVHPFYVERVLEPLVAAQENFAAEQSRIDRLASAQTWPDEAFNLDQLVADLAPLLESTRRAGSDSEERFRSVIAAYFDEIAPRIEGTGRTEQELAAARKLLEGKLAREYARYAQARHRWERSLLATIFDVPWRSALFAAIVTLPLAWLSTRVTPLPPVFEFPLMVALLAVAGARLSALLPGTAKARSGMLAEIRGLQRELDALP